MARLSAPWRPLIAVLALLGWLAGAGPVAADFDKGLRAYQAGKFDLALEFWLPAAKNGDPYAQHMIGFMYAYGRGVEKDIDQTLAWWRKSADQGHAPAQFALGSLYLNGIGVEKDARTAAKWIGAAADAGYADAQYQYGLMHAQGEGVERDVEAAMMWLNLAARQKGVSPTAYWTAILPYLTPAERRDARTLLDDWEPGAKKQR